MGVVSALPLSTGDSPDDHAIAVRLEHGWVSGSEYSEFVCVACLRQRSTLTKPTWIMTVSVWSQLVGAVTAPPQSCRTRAASTRDVICALCVHCVLRVLWCGGAGVGDACDNCVKTGGGVVARLTDRGLTHRIRPHRRCMRAIGCNNQEMVGVTINLTCVPFFRVCVA